jgi:hypothetical protein
MAWAIDPYLIDMGPVAGMLWMMERAGKKKSNNQDFQFWQQHNHPIELSTNEILQQRIDYLPRRQGGYS